MDAVLAYVLDIQRRVAHANRFPPISLPYQAVAEDVLGFLKDFHLRARRRAPEVADRSHRRRTRGLMDSSARFGAGSGFSSQKVKDRYSRELSSKTLKAFPAPRSGSWDTFPPCRPGARSHSSSRSSGSCGSSPFSDWEARYSTILISVRERPSGSCLRASSESRSLTLRLEKPDWAWTLRMRPCASSSSTMRSTRDLLISSARS